MPRRTPRSRATRSPVVVLLALLTAAVVLACLAGPPGAEPVEATAHPLGTERVRAHALLPGAGPPAARHRPELERLLERGLRPRAWRTERPPSRPATGDSAGEDSRLVAPVAALGPRSGYELPAETAVVLRLFEQPPQRWAAGHRGADLAVGVGAPVVAPAGGVVTFSGVVVDRGVMTVTHENGLRSSLEPVVGELPVGSVVSAGQRLGHVGASNGHCPTTCLHWGVRQGQEYLDPLDLLPGTGPVVLLP
jgi:murein DD-endopeptidase MepM/ murein hydrolase activator NlpD